MLETEPQSPNWPAWYGFAALGLALLVTLIGGGILFAIIGAATGIKSDDPGVNIGLTLVQDAALAGCAIWLAAQASRPHPWQFGVRGVRFLRGLKWGAIAFAIYFVFQLIYVAAVHPDQEQTTLKDLGAGNGAVITILIGLLVVAIAPFIEEFFFRGFFYGSLRTQFSFLGAAALDGLVFGAIHAPTGVEAVPPLIALGFALCVAYEATGSILPGVILHTLNNMIAFGTDKDGSWAVAGVSAVLVVTACVTLPGRSRTLKPDAARGT
jgi:membrane protease YdiL (CAAX protease family)